MRRRRMRLPPSFGSAAWSPRPRLRQTVVPPDSLCATMTNTDRSQPLGPTMSGIACGGLVPHRLDQQLKQELSALIDLISVNCTAWDSPVDPFGNKKLRAGGCELEVSTLVPLGGTFKGRGWHSQA